ncbi:MAG: hypothetical protein WCI04_05990, partial [archaeon]
MVNRVILTKSEAEKLLKAQNLGHLTAIISFDLGKSTNEVQITGDYFFIMGAKVPKKALSKIKEDTCYVLEDGEFKSIDFFSQDTN